MQSTVAHQYTRDHQAAGQAAGHCSLCRMLPAAMGENDAPGLLQAGQALYRQGDALGMLYSVHSGYFKSSTFGPDGSEQVLAFHMPGDILGLDAVHDGSHHSTATALTRSAACTHAYAVLAAHTRCNPELQRFLFSVMSREIGAYMQRMQDPCAEARLAGFLLELSAHFARRGYSARHLQLVMTRRDIGNYLRLATETVSRVLTRLQQDDLIRVRHREVVLLDPEGLKARA